jgi:hypothetical protein
MRTLHKKNASRSEDFSPRLAGNGDLTLQLRHSSGVTPDSPNIIF